MTRDGLRGRGAGALGLLMVLALVGSTVVPAYADNGPPQLPHLFAGTVTILNPPGLAAEGTLVEAFLDGEKVEETTVEQDGKYELVVPGESGDTGKTVTFKVGGVLANETATWESGGVNDEFDLTVPGESSFPLPLPCFVATAVYGSNTAQEIDVLREFRDAVLMPNRLGTALVSLYYDVSPPVAGVIARHDSLRTVLRLGLIDPMVAMLSWSRGWWLEDER